MAKKHRYRYSHERLDFETIPRTIRKTIGRILFLVGVIALLTIIYYISFSYFFDTPAERRLKRENQMLAEQYQAFSSKFEPVQTVIEDLGGHDRNIYRSIFQTDPLSSTEYGTYSGTNRYEELSHFSNATLVKESSNKLQHMSLWAKQQSALLDELLAGLGSRKDSLLCIPAMQPILNPGLAKTGASIGMRMHPFYKIPKIHNGIDFVAAEGTTVFATAKGIVVDVSNSPRDYGRRIIIDHGNGYQTVYAHLESALVKKGAKVERGDLIAYVGNTGTSMAPHLHYEIWRNEKVMEPVDYFFLDLSPDDYVKMMYLASNNGQSLD